MNGDEMRDLLLQIDSYIEGLFAAHLRQHYQRYKSLQMQEGCFNFSGK